MIMGEYRAIYKCRLCGEEFEDGRTGRDTAYMGAAVLTVKQHFKPEGCAIGIHKHNVHHCDDGSYGFADFIGFRKAEDGNESDRKVENRETKKKLREENIRLKTEIEVRMKTPYPVCTIERNVQKVCATWTAKGGVPIEIVKQELSHNLMKYLSGFVEYDFENDRYGNTVYTAILYVATGDRRYGS